MTNAFPPGKTQFQRFAAVIMRIRDPKTTALIFASGKMVVTGAKSRLAISMGFEEYGERAVHRLKLVIGVVQLNGREHVRA